MKDTKRPAKRILNTKEASEYLGGIITPKTLEKWRGLSLSKDDSAKDGVRRKKGPNWIDLDGRIGYRVEDLDEYIERSTRTPGDDFAA